MINLRPDYKGVLDQTQFNYTYNYSISSYNSFPDIINVNGILFETPLKIILYKQGPWESSSMKSNVLLENSIKTNADIDSSKNTV